MKVAALHEFGKPLTIKEEYLTITNHSEPGERRWIG